MHVNDYFSSLPNTLIEQIMPFCDLTTQNRVTETNKKLKTVFDSHREVLCFTIPFKYNRLYPKEIGNVHPMTLVHLLSRFPNIKTLSFAQHFSVYYVDILDPLISILYTNYPKKLQHVSITETEERLCKTDRNPKELTQLILNAFAHPQLLSLEIKPYVHGSNINGQMISAVLEKSKKLTTFNFKGFQLPHNFILEAPFAKCSQLKKIILENLPNLDPLTLNNISKCLNLSELSITKTSGGAGELERFLCTNHGLDLKVLDLEETSCFHTDESLDQATKYIPNLEFFSRCASSDFGFQISDIGLVQLANNCKKLQTLVFNFKNITNEGITHFAIQAPQLKKLATFSMYKVTAKGICALTEYCKGLEALELVHFSDLNPEVLTALAQNCKKLSFLSVSYGHSKDITLDHLRTFITRCENLKYFKIEHCGNIPKIPFEEFLHIRKPSFRQFYSV